MLNAPASLRLRRMLAPPCGELAPNRSLESAASAALAKVRPPFVVKAAGALLALEPARSHVSIAYGCAATRGRRSSRSKRVRIAAWVPEYSYISIAWMCAPQLLGREMISPKASLSVISGV